MKKYHILHLEDSQDDAKLINRELTKAGFDFEHFIVNDKESFIGGIVEFEPDIILCDHTLPRFNSIMAFEIYRAMKPGIPFILLTGTVSEEYAVEMLQNGVDDYILKSNLQRLPQAIHNALLKRENENKLRQAEQQRQFDYHNLEALINNTDDLMWSVDLDFNLITCNRAFDNITSLLAGKSINKGENIHSNGFGQGNLKHWEDLYKRAFLGETFTEIEYSDNPVVSWSEISFYPILKENTIIGTACFSRNITKNKIAEQKLKRQYETLSDISSMQSHQVRGPIATILGLVSLFNLKNPYDPINAEVLEKFKITTQKFDALVSDIVRKTNEIEMMK